MKEGRRAGGITAGPESKVLEGMTWEEARHLQVRTAAFDICHPLDSSYTFSSCIYLKGSQSQGNLSLSDHIECGLCPKQGNLIQALKKCKKCFGDLRVTA